MGVPSEVWEQVKRQQSAESRAEGRVEGLRPLLWQFERRVGRPLSAAEHASVLARFDAVGPERLGDVVLDLSPEALAAWLEDPLAR